MKNIGIIIGVIIIVFLGWYFVLPLFITQEVNESFPSEAELMQMSLEDREAIQDDMLSAMAGMPGDTVSEDMPHMGSASLKREDLQTLMPYIKVLVRLVYMS